VSTRDDLLARLTAQGHLVESKPNPVLGIPGVFLRHLEGSIPIVTVGGDLKTGERIGSLLDGLAWRAAVVSSDSPLVLRIARGPRGHTDDCIVHALQSLRHAYRTPGLIKIEREQADGSFDIDTSDAAEFGVDSTLHNWNQYLLNWYDLRPTGLARDIIADDATGTLRLYPQLTKPTKNPTWSLRMDGLQIGFVSSDGGEMSVGGKSSQHHDAQVWARIAGGSSPVIISNDGHGRARVRELVDCLIQVFGKDERGLVRHGQAEHSVEALILRGEGEVVVDGSALELPLQKEGQRLRVAWGSQIPTRWWSGGSRRSLDALMRRGPEPWAVEIKAAQTGGYGRYLRQGITQAVLYRHFLRSAAAIHPWMREMGMDPGSCRAALAIPEPLPGSHASTTSKLKQLEVLCDQFGVHLVQVTGTGLY
jgi:hypothetical protein